MTYTVLIEKGPTSYQSRCRFTKTRGVSRYSSEYHYSGENSMDKAVSAADANRRFSELLRTVKKGRSVVVTSHGKPVAKITPVVEDERAAEGGALRPFRPAPNRTSCECRPLDA